MNIWHAIVELISTWRTALDVAAGGLVIAIICTWPVLIPKTAQEWWAWARDAFQTAVPAARAQREAQRQLEVKTENTPENKSTQTTGTSSTTTTETEKAVERLP